MLVDLQFGTCFCVTLLEARIMRWFLDFFFFLNLCTCMFKINTDFISILRKLNLRPYGSLVLSF